MKKDFLVKFGLASPKTQLRARYPKHYPVHHELILKTMVEHFGAESDVVMADCGIGTGAHANILTGAMPQLKMLPK